jgi:hypothetical protein
VQGEVLFEHARFPLPRLGPEFRRQRIERWGAVDAHDTVLPIVKDAEHMSVIVTGGTGKHSSWPPTFGHGARPTRRRLALRRG